MNIIRRSLVLFTAAGALGLVSVQAAPQDAAAVPNASPGSSNNFSWKNLTSDIAGVARHTDANLVNPWGIAAGANGTIWINDNGAGVATVYNADGTVAPNATTPMVVAIPRSATNLGTANPTGIVANNTAFFKVTKNANSLPATFLFCSEDGSISGWNTTLDPTNAIIAVDNGATGAVYKGMTVGFANSTNMIYVTNFHSGRVEMYNQTFGRADTNSTFVDPNIPAGFAPFNIRNIGGQIYVTYAKQDAGKIDDVAGAGNGFVSVFDAAGTFVKRLISNDRLNSPWGLTAISSFGKFKNGLYVGNFGDGRINVYDLTTGAFIGTPRTALPDRVPLAFDGLWDLAFLNSGVIFFTAGIAGEEHGLFGAVVPKSTAGN